MAIGYATHHRMKNNVYKRKVAKTTKQLCLSVKRVILRHDVAPCFKYAKSLIVFLGKGINYGNK